MAIMKIVRRMGQAAGLIAAGDPVANSFTFMPTVNGLMIQVPLLDGNPLSFAMFETKDGRYVSPTGLYPHHLNGFLDVIGSPPNTESIA